MQMHEPLDTKTVLVTGAAGFLGSHLCHALLSHGHRVIGVDDLSHGDTSNLLAATKDSNFSFHMLDITDMAKLRAVSEGVDVTGAVATIRWVPFS